MEAWELRKRGLTTREIAAKIGISHSQVAKLLHIHLAEIKDKTAECITDVVKLEEERLDAMFAAVWMKAKLGDPDSVSAALRIMDRRAKLRGLDAPVKQLDNTPQLTDAELLDLANRYGIQLDPKLKNSLTAKPGGSNESGVAKPEAAAELERQAAEDFAGASGSGPDGRDVGPGRDVSTGGVHVPEDRRDD